MLQAGVLAVLVMGGVVAVWHIVLLGMCLGFVNAFDMPARQAFVVEMIEKRDDLGNAIALNSSMVNGARLVGPSVAGILIGAAGEGVCFLLNAISYVAVIVALLAMRIAPSHRAQRRSHVVRELKEGFLYVFNSVPIRSIVLYLGLVSLMGMPYQVLMPVFAKKILHGGPHTLGFLMASVGTGALVGALYLASRRSVLGLGKIIPVAGCIFGAGLIAFSRSTYVWLSLPLMLFTGFGMMVQMASSNTALQTIVDDDKRGRVMAFYGMAFMGVAPFGSLLAGGLANMLGAPNTILLGGATCILGASLFASQLPKFRAMVHATYSTKGLAPAGVFGVHTAGEATKSTEV
jgi:MFS family permease